MPDADTRPSHIPVLLAEVLRELAPRPGETYADATAGLGGHAAAVAASLGATGLVVLNDVDPGNLARAEAAVRAAATPAPRVKAVRGNFADLPRRLREAATPADLILADLGFASNQVEDAARGLSFMRDGPLDMRLDPLLPTTAADLVNSLPRDELVRLLRELGEEPAAVKIAEKVVRTRARTPITTTAQFAELVRSVMPSRPGHLDPATRSFQALRMAVNDELGVLDALLDQVVAEAAIPDAFLRPGARVGVITFHSLEDRLVKRAFDSVARSGGESRGPFGPSDAEVAANPRSRSAKLRVVRLGRGATDGGGRRVRNRAHGGPAGSDVAGGGGRSGNLV